MGWLLGRTISMFHRIQNFAKKSFVPIMTPLLPDTQGTTKHRNLSPGTIGSPTSNPMSKSTPKGVSVVKKQRHRKENFTPHYTQTQSWILYGNIFWLISLDHFLDHRVQHHHHHSWSILQVHHCTPDKHGALGLWCRLHISWPCLDKILPPTKNN